MDTEMSHYLCSVLTEMCLKNLNERITKQWTNLFQEILQGKNKEDIEKLFDCLKKYLVCQLEKCGRNHDYKV